MYASSAIGDIQDVYGTTSSAITYFYWVLFSLNIVYATGYYYGGYYVMASKRITWMQWWTYYALVGILGLVLLAYLHKFNILVFFTRLMIYVYVRYIVSMLATILLIPNWD